MARPFDAQIRELHGYDSRGARILSLYLRTTPEVGPTTALLEQVNSVVRPVRDGLGDAERAEFDDDLAMIRDYVSSMIAPPAAIALFASARRRYFRVVRLPVDVVPSAYWSPVPETGALRRLTERRQELQFGRSAGAMALK